MYRFLLALLLVVTLPVKAEDDSYTKLFEVHSRLAAKGSSEAQFKLGEMYEEGRGTERDLAKAREWYGLAAEQGHDEARKRLATLGSRLSSDDAMRLEREAQQARKRAEEERQAAMAQKRAEEERQAALERRQRTEEERERQALQRAEEERNRQSQAQRRAEEERARQAAMAQKRAEEERAQRAAASPPAAASSEPAKAPANSEEEKSFESDPCKGAAARFLSTCR